MAALKQNKRKSSEIAVNYRCKVIHKDKRIILKLSKQRPLRRRNRDATTRRVLGKMLEDKLRKAVASTQQAQRQTALAQLALNLMNRSESDYSTGR